MADGFCPCLKATSWATEQSVMCGTLLTACSGPSQPTDL